MNVHRFFSVCFAGLLAGLAACQNGDLGVGQQIVTPRALNVQIIDTITVQAATVVGDTFITNLNTDAAVMVGQWNDPLVGRTLATGFASINYAPNSLSTQTNVVYDSLVLVLPIDYAYGDTTQIFTLNVHRLNSILPTRSYSNQFDAAYEPTPYLSKLVRPGLGGQQVRIQLPAALQTDFINQLVSRGIENQDELNAYFRGFAFVTAPAGATTGVPAANVLFGLDVLGNAAGLTLYYHTNDLNAQNFALRFPLQPPRFSRVTTDRTGTPLQGLSLANRSYAVPSTLTQNQAFVIPSAQVRTRLTIPALDRFALGGTAFRGINRAELVVEPVWPNTRDNTYPFSGQTYPLYLYQTNNSNELVTFSNQLIGSVPTSAGSPTVSAVLNNYAPGALIPEYAYVFDITYYVNEIINGRLVNRPLLLSEAAAGSQLPQAQLVRRLTLGDARNAGYRLRLRLYVTTEPRSGS